MAVVATAAPATDRCPCLDLSRIKESLDRDT
jgi:hypothetical protein